MQAKQKFLVALGGVFGWIWLLTIPVSLWTFFAAVFTDAPWSRFLWSIGIAFIAKNLLRGFDSHGKRVALESHLVARGIPESTARELGYAAMNGGDAALRQKLDELGLKE